MHLEVSLECYYKNVLSLQLSLLLHLNDDQEKKWEQKNAKEIYSKVKWNFIATDMI
jgi:hypothetical protein